MSEANLTIEDAQRIIAEYHAKFANDPNMTKMPSMAMGFGNQIKDKLDEQYGVKYVKKRLELEEKLGLSESKEKSKDIEN